MSDNYKPIKRMKEVPDQLRKLRREYMLPIFRLMSLYLVGPSLDSEHKIDIFHFPPAAFIAFCKGHPTVQGQICSFAITLSSLGR